VVILEKDNELKEELEQEEIQEENVEDVSPKHPKKPKPKDKIQKLKAEIEALRALNADLNNEMLKDRAELENFKKRQKEEQIKDRIYANQSLISSLLTPLEYLDKACNFETDNELLKNFLLGFQMIDKQLFDCLADFGLKEIECKIGDNFDPKYHHALEKEHHEELEANKVLLVMSKGYMLKDRVIRPVMVKVSE
jgi:molecular chaperone GrpE